MRGLEEAALEPVRAGLTSLTEIARELGEPSLAPAPAEESIEPTILLVDDDAVNRTLARKLLQKHGYRVTEAGDGLEAMDRLAEERFTLMVLDLDMPRMGGREVLRRVRAEVEVMEAGADDYVRKPIDPPRFAARVKAALRRAALPG